LEADTSYKEATLAWKVSVRAWGLCYHKQTSSSIFFSWVFISVKFSVPSDSLCVSSIFYSLAAEAWGDKDHVAFQATFNSN